MTVRNVSPDALVVADEQAATLAESAFGDACQILLWENAYLRGEAAKVRSESAAARRPGAEGIMARLLVVTEPLRHDWISGSLEPVEFRVLDYLQKNMSAIFPAAGSIAVRIRPHPSESASKYAAWLRGRNWPGWQLAKPASLAADIAWADAVAGLHTYALVVALESGRRAISYLPPDAPPCALRHPGLEHLSHPARAVP